MVKRWVLAAMLWLVPGAQAQDKHPVVPGAVRYDWGDARLADKVWDCSYFRYSDDQGFALAHRQGMTLAQVDADFVKRTKDNGGTQRYCLNGLKRQFPEKAALLDQAIQSSDADLTAAVAAARAAFLARPVDYLWVGNPALHDWSLADMEKGLAALRGFKTLAQACGSFDYAMPPVDNAALARRDGERRAYGKCAETYRDEVYGTIPRSMRYNLKSTRTELDSFALYVCARYKQAGCIPDRTWKDFDRIASRSNLALYARVDALVSSEGDRAGEEVRRTNQWLEDVNAMVARYNQSH